MNAKTCFDILCISKDAGLDEAKRAYKRLVKCYHPDQYSNLPEKQLIAQEKLKEINVAYREIVSIYKNRIDRSGHGVENKRGSRRQTETRSFSESHPSFWHRVVSLVTGKLRSGKAGAHAQHTTRRHTRKNATPEFKQALKSAIQKQRRNIGTGRNRSTAGKTGKRIDPAKSGGGKRSVFRPHVSPKQSPGERIEKIRSVGRVKKIGD